MLKIGYNLYCYRKVEFAPNRPMYKEGNEYKIVGISEEFKSVFIYDERGTKRPISTDRETSNRVRVYWEDHFICSDIRNDKIDKIL